MGITKHNMGRRMIADLGIALLGTGQQPLAKFHQGVVVSRVRGMLLENQYIQYL